MIRIYPCQLKAACLILFMGILCSSLFAQTATCGPISENFDNTGNTMAGFSSSTVLSTAPGFTYARNGADGFLQRCNIPSGGTVFQLVTPTYASAASQTAVGYGFELGGIVKVSRVVVLLQYVDNSGNINTVEVENFEPTYAGPLETDIASVCRSVAINSFNGFTPGESYRLVFQLTASSASNASQCITFDDFRTTGVNALAPLPVSFIGFTAIRQDNTVQLLWNVAGEKEVMQYEVERSSNGKDFVALGTVRATGGDAYAWVDAQPLSGISFYRVRNIDIDGRYKYTGIVRVNTSKDVVVRAYPQPAHAQVIIEHKAFDSKGSLTLTSASGQVVLRLEVKAGDMQTPVTVSILRPGIYVVRLEDGQGAIETLKLVKQ